MPKGSFFVVTGASGAGKTTVVERALAEYARTGEFTATRLVTMTTRPRRARPDGSMEEDGVDYHFKTLAEFLAINERGGFFEFEPNYAPKGDKLYGSPMEGMRAARAAFDVTFAILDPKGAATARRKLGDDVAIVVVDAEADVLEARLRSRQDPNIEARIAGIPSDRAVALAIPDRSVIRTDDLNPTATMHRLLEIVRHRASLA